MHRKVRIISGGGIGDAILATPSFRAISERDSSARIYVYCMNKAHIQVYKNNPFIAGLRHASFLRSPLQWLAYFFNWRKFYVINYGGLLPSLFYSINATRIIGEMLDVTLDEQTKVELFVSEREVKKAQATLASYKKPIVIHVTSRCSGNQHWPQENWEQLIAEMHEYTFIQLGDADESKIEGAIDLRGKTSLIQAFALIKCALSFVGVVSSLSHATNAFDTPGVVLFGPSIPKVWGHSNNINLYKNSVCSPCIDTLHGAQCPYDKQCMRLISVEEVKQALMQQLSKCRKEF